LLGNYKMQLDNDHSSSHMFVTYLHVTGRM
jgi:hypothetical protein